LFPLEFHTIKKDVYEFRNLGFTLEVFVDESNTLEGGGLPEQYDLLEFHYHAPAEHTINGVVFPLELQLVHTNDDGDVAIVSVLFEEGEEEEHFLNSHLVEIDEIPDKGDVIEVEVEPYSLIKSLHRPISYYQYVGSLTIPPCSEDVRWFVLTERPSLSSAQLSVITSTLAEENNRPIQTNGNPVRAFLNGPLLFV
jgi:carbonic anhydrase